MKGIVHIPLEIFSHTLNTKGKLTISECTLRRDKGGLMLIGWFEGDLVVARETIHKGKSVKMIIVIDNMVNERHQIIIF